MLTLLLRGLFGRLLGYATFALGFWLLFQGISRPSVGLGILGGGMVLDCDATLRTDLGSLATIGESKPENLVHFVFDDASHQSTGGLPVKGVDAVDFVGMARGAGYVKTYQFDKLEEFFIGLEDVMAQPGPVFVLVKVFRDAELPAMPHRSMAEGWATMRQTLRGQG
jgi:hypothetical protein